MAKCKEHRPCGCEQASVCGCDIKLDLLCAFYSGVDLQPLGITAGMDGNTVIKIINDYLTELDLDPTIIQSVGNGAEVYKGLSLESRHEIKSLIEGEGIIITEQNDTITLSIDPSIIPTPETPFTGENVGVGSDVFIDDNSTVSKFRRIGSADNSLTITGSGNNGLDMKVNFPSTPTDPLTSLTSIGGGIDVYQGMNGTIAQINTIEQGDGILITSENGRIKFDIPASADDTIKQFYVNENNTKPNANGSILKPFPKLTQALDTVIGSGTRVQPEFPGAIINLQTDVTVSKADLDSVTKLGGRISVNNITIQSDSDSLRTMNVGLNSDTGLLDYPIDTQELCNTARGASTDLPYNIQLTFKNIVLNTTRMKGSVRHWSYDLHGVFDGTKNSATINLINFVVLNYYHPEEYVNMKNSNGTNAILLSRQIMCESTISNTTPHVYFYGRGNVGEGKIFLSDLQIKGSSQTHLRLYNTTANLGEVRITSNSWMASVADQNVVNGIYSPKIGLFALHNDSSYYRLDNFLNDDQIAINDVGMQGSFDSLFRNEKTNPSGQSTSIIQAGYVLTNKTNSIVSTDQSFSDAIQLFNCDFVQAQTYIGAFVKTGGTTIKDINITGSTVRNVKPETTSYMRPAASHAIVNGYEFTDTPFFENDGEAYASGLISNNIYYNITTKIPKRLP